MSDTGYLRSIRAGDSLYPIRVLAWTRASAPCSSPTRSCANKLCATRQERTNVDSNGCTRVSNVGLQRRGRRCSVPKAGLPRTWRIWVKRLWLPSCSSWASWCPRPKSHFPSISLLPYRHCLLIFYCDIHRKRASPRHPSLPEELQAIWEPLIDRLNETFDSFLGLLTTRILDSLILTQSRAFPLIVSANAPLMIALFFETGLPGSPDHTYHLTLTAWALQLVGTNNDPSATRDLVRTCLLCPNP
jgi:hypothetical protein